LLRCSISLTLFSPRICVNSEKRLLLCGKAASHLCWWVKTLNEVYSSLTMRRRYEVWFIRFGLADGSGAWWFRYLLFNPGREGCPECPFGAPLQVWATWFPHQGKPNTFIQGFPLVDFRLSPGGRAPFHFEVGNNSINESSCRGQLHVDGHEVSWDLSYRSTFLTTLSSKGWIGFSRTPHSDAIFSGYVSLDGKRMEGNPLGFGLQGHNCGYRHRNFWRWVHAYFARPVGQPSTFEALVYDMPLGLIFRKAVLWHEGKQYLFHRFREIKHDPESLQWVFDTKLRDGARLQVAVDGRGTASHRLPYLKTDCSGTFEVFNNSLASAAIQFQTNGAAVQHLETSGGAVLEMGGRQ
jgi:hypothetical protein